MQSFDEAHKNVIELVGRFGQNLSAYKDGSYNETQVRLEFINPFFEALGWDVRNEGGYAEQYKDVVHEDAVKVGVSTKAPDYSFRIGGQRKFFLEAKKPSVNIKGDPAPAYQLRRYGWSAKLPLSILTDFEEFAVYECMRSPSPKDAPAVGRVEYYTFDQYPEKFQEIYDKFGKDAVLKGSFDRYAAGAKGKRGTAAVDSEFLKVIEGWRLVLAKELAKRNPSLGIHELNFSVQQSIDRIVFLRIAEDRGVEKYGALQALTNGTNVYRRLLQLYDTADRKYNSGLFDFKSDTLSHTLSVDDKVLKDIIAGLYYPSPYEFSVIGPEILGDVYEQFLGKVIRMTPARTVKVEDKPEVKKAGGVYYTPGFVVDYIVKNTVGKWLTGKKPKQAEALKVLDPACGSGSFLLRAYQYLLDWHLDYYVADGPDKYAKGKAPALYRAQGGVWRLTTTEKKRILLNNVFGVDIDRQAVEVTKLSLLLKVLEGENDETLKTLNLFGERALPSLEGNVKCGNSLVGPDFYTGRSLDIFGEEDVRRVNAFDWTAEFPAVMGAGGFDCVVGNPPYIRIQNLQEFSPETVEHFKGRYVSSSKGNYDIYVVFVEKGLSLLNKEGRLGFILPHKFFQAQYGEPLRGLVSKGKHLAHVVHFGDQQVFAGATTYTNLMFLDKAGAESCRFVKVDDLEAWKTEGKAEEGLIASKGITGKEWNFVIGAGAGLMERLREMPVKLGDVAHLFVGLQTDADDVYILEEIERDNDKVLCSSKATGQKHWFENTHLKPFLKGSLNIRRYALTGLSKRLIFPYEMKNGKSTLIDAKEYSRQFPLTWQYLLECRKRLSARHKGEMGKDWYGYVYKKNHTRFSYPKLLVPAIGTRSSFAIDVECSYYFVGSGGGGGGGYGVTLNQDVEISYSYLLGLLNSKLLDIYLKSFSSQFSGGYYAYNRQYIQNLPIRPIDFTDKKDAARHDRMVGLVTRMLELNKKLAAASTPADKDLYKRQVDATDKEIDALVYELYGLTKEEIKVVEG